MRLRIHVVLLLVAACGHPAPEDTAEDTADTDDTGPCAVFEVCDETGCAFDVELHHVEFSGQLLLEGVPTSMYDWYDLKLVDSETGDWMEYHLRGGAFTVDVWPGTWDIWVDTTDMPGGYFGFLLAADDVDIGEPVSGFDVQPITVPIGGLLSYNGAPFVPDAFGTLNCRDTTTGALRSVDVGGGASWSGRMAAGRYDCGFLPYMPLDGVSAPTGEWEVGTDLLVDGTTTIDITPTAVPFTMIASWDSAEVVEFEGPWPELVDRVTGRIHEPPPYGLPWETMWTGTYDVVARSAGWGSWSGRAPVLRDVVLDGPTDLDVGVPLHKVTLDVTWNGEPVTWEDSEDYLNLQLVDPSTGDVILESIRFDQTTRDHALLPEGTWDVWLVYRRRQDGFTYAPVHVRDAFPITGPTHLDLPYVTGRIGGDVSISGVAVPPGLEWMLGLGDGADLQAGRRVRLDGATWETEVPPGEWTAEWRPSQSSQLAVPTADWTVTVEPGEVTTLDVAVRAVPTQVSATNDEWVIPNPPFRFVDLEMGREFGQGARDDGLMFPWEGVYDVKYVDLDIPEVTGNDYRGERTVLQCARFE